MIRRTGCARLSCGEFEPAAENQQGDPAEHDGPGCDVHAFEIPGPECIAHRHGKQARRRAEHAADRSGQVQFLLQAIHSASPLVVARQYSNMASRGRSTIDDPPWRAAVGSVGGPLVGGESAQSSGVGSRTSST